MAIPNILEIFVPFVTVAIAKETPLARFTDFEDSKNPVLIKVLRALHEAPVLNSICEGGAIQPPAPISTRAAFADKTTPPNFVEISMQRSLTKSNSANSNAKSSAVPKK